MEEDSGDGARPPARRNGKDEDIRRNKNSSSEETESMEIDRLVDEFETVENSRKKKKKLQSIVSAISKVDAVSMQPKAAATKPTAAEVVKSGVAQKQTRSTPPEGW